MIIKVHWNIYRLVLDTDLDCFKYLKMLLYLYTGACMLDGLTLFLYILSLHVIYYCSLMCLLSETD